MVIPRVRLDRNWILVAALAVFAIAPLTYPGIFQARSGFLPVFNAEHLSDAPNWGRVPDVIRGEGKLPYLLIWPFARLPGSGVTAIKWGYGLAFLLSALGAYAWTRRWLGGRGGALAATVYTYLPWHLTTVYVRGAYAEAWLWAFWPWILWAADSLGTANLAGAAYLPGKRRTLAAALVGLSLIAAAWWTQAGLTAILMLGMSMTILLRVKHLSVSEWAAGLLPIAVVAIAALVLPSSEARVSFADHFLHPYQLFSAAWGSGQSFQLGLAAVGLGLVVLALRLVQGTAGLGANEGVEGASTAPLHALGPRSRSWAIILLGLLLLTLAPSSFFWKASGLGGLLTYPWQLLTLAGLPLAFLAGSVVRLDARLAEFPAWMGLVVLVVLASYPYLAPRFTPVDLGPEPAAFFQPVEADAPQIMILDYDIAPPTEITPTLTLTLTWQAVEPVTGDYTVFVHVLTQDGAKAAQRDTRPCGGECPTQSWQPGQIIADRYQLDLPDAVPPGPYHLAIGLYLLDSGERATVVGRDDQMAIFDVP